MTIVMLLMTIVWAEEINSKMILSSHIKSEEAAKSLYLIETFFQENTEARNLKKSQHLELAMELLDKYILVTITQIKSSSVENRLQYLLKEKFPHSFIIRKDLEIPVIKKQISKQGSLYSQSPNNDTLLANTKQIQGLESKLKTFFNSIDKKWMAIFFLLFFGFMLYYKSVRQLKKIKKLQKELAKYQIILEDEVDRIGVSHG